MKNSQERTGIKISIMGSALLAFSAVVMALIAKSQAVLLDGLYTFITLLLAFVSLKVIDLVEAPETRTRPFGYMAFEPFLNLIKSLVVLTLLCLFLITNIQELCTGGRQAALDMMSLYIFVCLGIYAAIILLLKQYKKGTQSSILELEILNWYIDALITTGIAVALVAAMLLLRMGYSGIRPYVDPVITIVLVAVSVPVPLKTLLIECKRLLLVSAENSIEGEVQQHLAGLREQYGLINTTIWGLKSGRTQYLFVYTALKDERTTITQLDKIRAAIFRELATLYPKFWADIMFTNINPDEPFLLTQQSSHDA